MQPGGVAGVFERAAPTYDQVGVDLFGPVADALVEELDPQPGERVLDAGCGRGAVLLRAARRAGRADGLDLSPAMVQGACAEAAAQGLDVEVRVEDAAAPDRPLASYDVVASSLVLFFLPDPPAALRAWRRLLAHRGRLGVTTFGPTDGGWTADGALMAHAPPALRDARTTGGRGPFASDDGVEQLLSDAGLLDVRTRRTVVAVRFDDLDHWYRWSWSLGQRAVWEALDDDARARVRAEVEEHVRASRQPDGRYGFDQQVRVTTGRR